MGRPLQEYKAREMASIPLSMERSARHECIVFDGKMKSQDWFGWCKLCIFSNICSSCLLDVIGLTCSNEKWTRVTCSILFPIMYAKNSDQRICIPSNIYHKILSSRLNDFCVQGRIRFEFSLRISGWARIVSFLYNMLSWWGDPVARI